MNNKVDVGNTGSEQNKTRKPLNRKRMTIIITIVIGFLFTFFAGNRFYRDVISEYEKDMKAAVSYGRLEYIDNLEKSDIYLHSCKDGMGDIAAFTAFVYEELGYSVVARDELLDDVGAYATYYYFKGSFDAEKGTVDGKMFSEARGHEMPKLTDEELITLFSTGFYELDEDILYSSAPVSDEGYVILVWGVEDILKKQSILSAYADKREVSVMRVDTESGIIEDAMDESLVGTDCSEYIGIEELRQITPNVITDTKLADGSRVEIFRDEEDDDQIFFSFIYKSDILPDTIRGTAIPIVLGWMFLLLVMAYILKFSSNRKDDEKDIKYTRIFRKLYVDKTLMQHVISISFFAVILIIIGLLYFQTLINFSEQNIKANNSLKTLDSVVNLNDENSKLLKDDYLGIRTILINDITKHFLRHPETLTEETIKRLCDKLPYTQTITLYNGHGDIEIDTKGNVGYTLSKDESLPEYKCWDIINGISDSVCYLPSPFGYSDAHIAARRQDKEGLVVITQASIYINDFDVITSLDNELLTSYFGTASKAYIELDNPDSIHWLDANSEEIEIKNNTLSEAAMTNGYSGIVRIDGIRYYINTRENDEKGYLLISAKPLKELYGLYSYYILIEIIIAFLLQQMMILILSGHRITNDTEKYIEVSNYGFLHQTLDEQMMDERFRKVIRSMFIATCIMIVVLLVFDSLYGKTSLLGYLFASEWPKGLNLFSVTMILILAAIVIVAGGIIQFLISFFTKNMGPRGVTIGRMSNSLIKFAILIIIAFNVLLDLGIKSSTLMTGAGIFGVAFSLFAQQTLNDFLCGFFIVFEGAYNIGDWIIFGDWRGQVVEISIRTTKIAKGGNVMVINNSELKEVIVMAKNGTGARVFFDIAYKEDADAVIALIENNTERYQAEIPALYEGPYVDGVVGLGESGVSIRMWGLSEQSSADSVERDMLRVTKKILDENGIEIPFTQVTIHTAND